MSLPADTRLGPFQIIAELGSGGMGEVYRARDVRLGREVALKIVSNQSADAQALERFDREARAASALNHPNICTVYEVGSPPAGPSYLAMELLTGETLQQRLCRGPLSLTELLDIGVGIADALDAAHAHGIIHRDLKPSNVFLTAHGPKLLDFGIATISAREGDDTVTAGARLTSPGSMVGTVAYMSPEQLAGLPVDPRSDLFSMGLLLYEMATGRPAFDGVTSALLSGSILHEEPSRPSSHRPDLPEPIEAVILKALEKDRDLRCQSAAELRADLRRISRAFAAGAASPGPMHPVPVLPSATITHAGAGPRRFLWLLSAVIIVTAGGLAISWIARGSRRQADQLPATRETTLRQMTRDGGLTTTPAMSRDGRLIAYASDRDAEQLDLWVQQVAGGEPLQITRHAADDYDPVFSPDGTTITFRSDRDGGGIYLVSALGGSEKLLAARGRNPRVSPDGKWVVYWVGSAIGGDPTSPGSARLFLIESVGGVARSIASEFAAARFPIWSPDGRLLMFQGSPELTKPLDWCVVSVTEGPVKCLNATAFGFKEGFELHAVAGWAEDYLIFSVLEGDALDLWRVRFDPQTLEFVGKPERLTQGTGNETSPAFGSDGRILFADVSTSTDIWSIDLDSVTKVSTGAERQVTHSGAMEYGVSGSGDGSKLVFASNRAGQFDIWLLDLADRSEKRLTQGHQIFSPRLDWRGERLAYERIENGKADLRLLTIATGQDESLCADQCGNPVSWSPDGQWVLAERGDSIRAIHLPSKRFSDILQRRPLRLWQASVNPRTKVLAFLIRPSDAEASIALAPFEEDRPVSPAQWVTLASGGNEDKLRWSADGRTLYFVSDRDGFRCVWGQRITSEPLQAAGDAFAVFHSHRARRSMKDLRLPMFSMWVIGNELFFVQAEKTGNIWMMEGREAAR